MPACLPAVPYKQRPVGKKKEEEGSGLGKEEEERKASYSSLPLYQVWHDLCTGKNGLPVNGEERDRET